MKIQPTRRFLFYDSKLITTSHKTATSILSIQIPAYEIEAKYINSTAIPRLYDTVADIQSCDEIFTAIF